MVLKIANEIVKPGDRKFHRLKVTNILDGSELTIPLHVVSGTSVEPVLGLTCLEHGGECIGVNPIRNVLNTIDTSKLQGTILAIPVMNPLAFAQGDRLTPRTSKWPGHDVDYSDVWTLSFKEHPGRRSEFYAGSREEGDISLTEAMVKVITDEFWDKLDYCVQFHGKSGGALKVALFDPYLPFSFEMAKVFGMGLIHDRFTEKPPRRHYLSHRGAPSMTAELGGGGHGRAFEEAANKILVRGTFNVMKLIGMIDGEPEVPEKQLVYKKSPHIRPTRAGYLLSNFEAADVGVGRPTAEVKKGDILGTLFDPYTLEITEELVAPIDGLVNGFRVSGPVEAFMRGYAIADSKDPEAKWI